jgi:PPOX class probable F420-dependent enzyme
MAKRRNKIAMSTDEIDAFLHERQTMNVATFGPDGNIHLVAMWYGFLGDNPAFETYTKSQKVLNVRRDPRITVIVEDGDVYEELRGVEIVGHAIVHEDRDTLMGVAQTVVERYWNPSTPEEAALIAEGLATKRVAIEIVPEKIVSWDHSKLGGTY